VFALSDEELGETELAIYDINTGNIRPIRAIRISLAAICSEEKLEEELKWLLDINCIEHNSSSYASPLVLVRKNNGALKGMCSPDSIQES